VRLLVAGAVLLAIGFAGGLYLLRDRPQTCSGAKLPITVAAAPDIAPALGEIAAAFNLQRHEVAGRCAHVSIVARDPARIAVTPAGTARPVADGWVPDSSMWLERARAAGLASPRAGASLATSPVVIAAPRAVAAELRRRHVADGWRMLRRPPLNASVRALDPARNAAGAATTIALGDTVGAVTMARDPDPSRLFESFAGLPGLRRPLVITSEQSVVAYNDAHRPNPASVIVPAEGTILLDHPLVTMTADRRRAQAVDAFRWALGARRATDTFQRDGFRLPDGSLDQDVAARLGLRPKLPRILPQPDTADVTAAMGTW
jgi:Bacterial extracellular solute-binding protein